MGPGTCPCPRPCLHYILDPIGPVPVPCEYTITVGYFGLFHIVIISFLPATSPMINRDLIEQLKIN